MIKAVAGRAGLVYCVGVGRLVKWYHVSLQNSSQGFNSLIARMKDPETGFKELRIKNNEA